jgi:hypothetical protein
VLAVFAISGPDPRERRRFMSESQEFQAAFDAALRERGDDTIFQDLADLCRGHPNHMLHLRHEAESLDARRALQAKAGLFWIERPDTYIKTLTSLTENPPRDVYPSKAIQIDSGSLRWRVKALLKHVGPDAKIPLLELAARFPDARIISRGVLPALVHLWDAPLMDRPLFAMFDDPSYSDTFRVDMALAFARRSSQPYAVGLRKMLADPRFKYHQRDLMRLLGDLRDTAAIPLLRQVFLDDGANAFDRRDALAALDQIGDPEVMNLSLRAYATLDPKAKAGEEILRGIAEVFGAHGDEKALPLLKPLTERGYMDDAMMAADKAIEQIQQRVKGCHRLDASAE